MNLLSQISVFLKSNFFVELCIIFSILGICTFIIVLILYPIFLNLIIKHKENHGRNN